MNKYVANNSDNMSGPQAPTQRNAPYTLNSERLGPLPLVNAFLQRMGLEKLLDQYVPTTDKRTALSHAQALGVLLRSIVVEREPIYRQQETVYGFAPSLFGISAQQMARLGDDRIGRALDRLFDADRAALLTEVVVCIGQRFGVAFDRLHNDSTSIAFCGQYRAAQGRALRGRSAPAIVHGFSKDHRPDLKQLLFILTAYPLSSTSGRIAQWPLQSKRRQVEKTIRKRGFSSWIGFTLNRRVVIIWKNYVGPTL
jgi:hypothetical protein